MTNEDFPQPGNGESDPSELEPTSEATKQELLETIKSKRDGGSYVYVDSSENDENPHPSYLTNRLRIPGIDDVKYSISYIIEEDRTSPSGFMGDIGKTVQNGPDLEQRIYYRLRLTPDNTLEIDKVMHLFDRKGFNEDREAFWEAIEAGDQEAIEESTRKSREFIEDLAQSSQKASELGLTFVSQQEAETILEELKKAQPYSG